MKPKTGKKETETPELVKLSVRVDPRFLKSFKAACALNERTMSDAVVEAASEWVESYFPGFMAGLSPDGKAALQGRLMPTTKEMTAEAQKMTARAKALRRARR